MTRSLPRFHPSTAAKIGLLALVGFALYFPALRGDWLWDDGHDVAENLVIHGPIRALSGIWFAPTQTDYFPLKATVQWIEWHLWSDNRLGYHLVNLALHILSACLLWRILGRLGVRLAWLGGLVFLIHPLAVESVAWISELKNTLSLPLLLLAWDAHLDAETEGARLFTRSRLASLGWFLAAMLSKASVVMMPVCLLLYAWWRSGRIKRRDLAVSAPYFGIAAVLGIVAILFQAHRAIGPGPYRLDSWEARTAAIALHLLSYLGRFLWPADLVALYPRQSLAALHGPEIIAWIALILMVGGLWKWRSSIGRAGLFGFGWFVINLMPALGVIPMAYMEYSWEADHFEYISIVGLAGLAAAGYGAAETWLGNRSKAGVLIGRIAAILLLAALGSVTPALARHYRDSVTFWTWVIERNPSAWSAHHNLAVDLQKRPGRTAEALAEYETAIRLNPRFAMGHFDYSTLLAKLPGREEDAIAQLQEALQLKPDLADAHNNLADLLSKHLARWGEAEEHYREALRLQPDFPEAENNWAQLLSVETGREGEAIAHYEAAIRMRPDYAEAYVNLGAFLSRFPDRATDAEAQYRTALRIRPDYAEADYNFALLLSREPGRQAEAISRYEAALKLKANYPEAHNNLGTLLARMPGREGEAEGHLRAAIGLNPDFAQAHNNLGLLLASEAGREEEALAEYRTALRLQPDFAQAHGNLATLLSRIPGKGAEAEQHFEAALQLDPDYADGQNNWANWLSGQPGREADAVLHYQAALRLLPDSFVVETNLALVLSRIPGRSAEAVKHLSHALELGPGYPPAEQALSNLRAGR